MPLFALMPSSFEHFPIEIALHIINTAVRIFVTHDRQSAFHIAIVCRATFAASAPHLYRSLAIRLHLKKGPGGRSREIFLNVLKYVQHLYISDKKLDDMWAVRLLAAWWPPAGTEAFIDAPLPIIRLAWNRIESHKYSGVTGLRLSNSTLEGAFLPEFRGSLPEEWTMRLTRVIAPFPLKEKLSHSQDVWVEKLFSAAPSLVQLGFQITNHELVSDEIATAEAIIRRLLMRKTGECNRNTFQMSHLCLQVACNSCTETFKLSMQSLVSRINDDRLTIWIDERVPRDLDISERDKNLDAAGVRARWDFWVPEDRRGAIVYRAGRYTR